jgi:ribosomal-protein-alanine N-acetyltransferase
MGCTLRDFRREDFITLFEIDQRCFAPGIAYSQSELHSYIHRRNAFTLVAEAEDEKPAGIAGFVVAETRHGTGHIITIDVLPAARRGRVGSKLLSGAEERLRAKGCHQVYLETAVDNQVALIFYKRHDYFLERVIPHYYANGVDALILLKRIARKDLLSTAQAS